MQLHFRRDRPGTWTERRNHVRHSWLLPFVWVEHVLDWAIYVLSNWRLLEVLDYLGSFGVLIAVIFYFAESGDRLKQKHYQAWQVINSAQGKGGNGGRIEALAELNADGVPLVGVDVSSAFLQGVRLIKANLTRANFDAVDARDAVMPGARIEDATLRSANFRAAGLAAASFRGSVLDDGDFSAADLRGADLTAASLQNADLRYADLEGLKWNGLKSIKGTNLYGAKNAPQGFLDWALGHGAVRVENE